MYDPCFESSSHCARKVSSPQRGREDLAVKEETELAILEEYLPEQLSAEEVRKVVQEAILSVGASSPADMGKIMKEVMPQVRGKADGKMVNQIVKETLSG